MLSITTSGLRARAGGGPIDDHGCQCTVPAGHQRTSPCSIDCSKLKATRHPMIDGNSMTTPTGLTRDTVADDHGRARGAAVASLCARRRTDLGGRGHPLVGCRARRGHARRRHDRHRRGGRGHHGRAGRPGSRRSVPPLRRGRLVLVAARRRRPPPCLHGVLVARAASRAASSGAIETAALDAVADAGRACRRSSSSAARGAPSIEAYASGGLGTTFDEVAAWAAAQVAAGFGTVKFRAMTDPDTTIALLDHVVSRLPAGIALHHRRGTGLRRAPLVDCDDAIRVGHHAAALGARWYEEPCQAEDVAAYAAVRARGRMSRSRASSPTAPSASSPQLLDAGARRHRPARRDLRRRSRRVLARRAPRARGRAPPACRTSGGAP